ncbi:hypothetical protein LEP1GSC162_2088 [Leptospira santarosai str. CBC1531]|uniref:Uncharacterized protein n=1 Tax=Leptospira santarosai str. MOR084 TaxID=1049984 RepID=A0A0E2BS32_9LEPT|nr:hypothetical protein [Leptospira santarosai]EKO34267.1 hypothetical protein LEP1GSC179_1788 [Leptospira santarosai str. MOR084]EMP79792.1 hypothetical protein LEP1GSC162_2088 [Leptospira santarosai str. CBC1531]
MRIKDRDLGFCFRVWNSDLRKREFEAQEHRNLSFIVGTAPTKSNLLSLMHEVVVKKSFQTAKRT